MAAETPVLERNPAERLRMPYSASMSYADCFNEEEIHNARIRDTYARLINPESKIEDFFSADREEEVIEEKTVDKAEAVAPARPYLVENARADSVLFRADNPINRAVAQNQAAEAVDELDCEEDDEDLRPTATTIQYQTISRSSTKSEIKSSTGKKGFVIGKKEKIIIAVFVSVIIALLALVIINSAVIAGLNNDIAVVQSEINTVRGALAGVNSSINESVPEAVRDLLIK